MTKYRWLILFVVGIGAAVVGKLIKSDGITDLGGIAAVVGLMDVVF